MNNVYIVSGFSEECATFRAANAAGGEMLTFSNGMPIAVPESPIPLVLSSPGIGCDCPGLHAGGPCISQRAWDCLRALIEPDVQAIPVVTPDGVLFYALNVVNVIDCLNREKSELSIRPMFKPTDYLFISAIYKYHFDVSKIGASAIFKTPELVGREVYVTQLFKEAVEDYKLTGFLFRRIFAPQDACSA
jgi:hypothetical protein